LEVLVTVSPRSAPTSGVDWNEFEAVIFDVDGTLFDHLAIRPTMAAMLLKHVLTQRHGWRDLRVLRTFRRVRSRLAMAETGDIGHREFEETSKATGFPIDEVKNIVALWIYEKPLPIIGRYTFPGVVEFIAALKARNIRIGVFSDYPAEDKLKVLGLSIDVVRDATSSDIARLKPNPSGFLRVAELLGKSPSCCLVIGDREDRDGAAAKQGGFVYLQKISGWRRPNQYHFKCYVDLIREIAGHSVLK
jgi:putative hydrolase of the HAD superfamily